MKTIIHIGQHKTGTTSTQKFLQDNRGFFAENGLYVPSSIAGYKHPSHYILNVYALDEGRYSSKKEEIVKKKGSQYLSELEIELKKDIKQIYQTATKLKCNKVIWSNEGLYLLNSEIEYKRLISLFSEYSTEIEVVCCFRDVKSYRKSYMEQLSKQNIPLSNDPESYRYLKKDSWLFDYKRKKTLLSAVFDQCTYFPYDAIDNVKNFMGVIGFNTKETGKYRENVTVIKHNKFLQWIKKSYAFFNH